MATRVTWKQLLAEGRVEHHATSRDEIDGLRGVVERNLQDASLAGLSPDNSFGLAYESALLLGKMVVACEGYRVKGAGAHHATFLATALAMGSLPVIDYFDRCWRKRNVLSYDASKVATASEAAEIRKAVPAFRKVVEDWIRKHRPELG